jgi:two-component system chemotaxis sensor kinase CheA
VVRQVGARDPYRYFRVEARELVEGLGQAALALESDREKGAAIHERVVHMLRLAHTLKGAARVVRQAAIADAAHAIEDLLEPHAREGADGPAPDRIDRILRALDGISEGLAALGAPAAQEKGASPAAETLESVRVEIGEMDALLLGVSEAGVRLAALRRDLQELTRARGIASGLAELRQASARGRASVEELQEVLARLERGLGAGLDQVDREVGQVRERAHRLRLLPASTVFPVLERAARDAAHTLDRSIAFEVSGGDSRLESHVLLALRDALLHVVRNAVSHGIEPEAERRRLGKPPAGRVELAVERRGNRVAFVCRDDGRGIDAESIRRVAVARGIATAQQAAVMGRDHVLRLALESGVTTVDAPREVSGRGVGLDVLRATVAGLKGEVKISSQEGQGTQVELSVPISVSSIAVLVLQADDATCSLPLDSVWQSLRVSPRDFARTSDKESIVVDGVVVPFVPLAQVLGTRGRRGPRDGSWSAVVVRHGERMAALGADQLIGTSTLVARPLPPSVGTPPLVAAVSLDSDGDPQLVLDPAGIIEAAHGGIAARGEVAAPAMAPVLVIDDSLTTRMLEQSILESAGYAVDLATSAEEGLAKALKTPHCLFLVDVEMPGMDGFEFVSRTRADPALRSVPAILVSSRNGAEDRRKGEQAGAGAYIVKGEFDQSQFLKTIRKLIGGA